MEEIEKLKKTILAEYPRLNRSSEFSFKCHPGVSCFNDCCADVNIFLTPYDILRLKHNLGISSEEFLSKYTISPFDEKLKYPIVLLKMEDDEHKSCPFVGKDGCRVYPDRPWACRMYPLGLASPKENSGIADDEFYFLLQEDICRGFNENRRLSIGEWIKEQGIAEYDAMGKYHKELTLHDFFQKEGNNLTPAKVEMFFMACYNLDKFREFIFCSSFLDKFEIDQETGTAIKDDDAELLKFGYRWLRFALFGEKTLKIKDEIVLKKKSGN